MAMAPMPSKFRCAPRPAVSFGALLLLLLTVRRPVHCFVFTPTDPNNGLFDTWLFVPQQPADAGAQPEAGDAVAGAVPAFYFNYLSACKAASCGVEPYPVVKTGGAPWNGVGGATSPDGVHFADQGVLFRKDPRAVWLGSGSVLKNAAGEYVMNFSEDYDCGSPNCQSIFFATSKDLKTWTRLPFAPPPANDSNVFKYNSGGLEGKTPGYRPGRWDCIATVPKPGAPGHYIGYWTASPSGHGGAGLGETTDLTGYHWKALPPITENMPTQDLEVGSVAVLGGRYYMLYGGGHLYSSDTPTSGFKPDARNHNFLTDGRGIDFSRIWWACHDDDHHQCPP
eukprot:SAG22_NODE_930_length_6462_cov_4.402326_1_plen_338_part_00